MSAAIYWLAIRCYAIILRIAALFNPKAKLFVRGRKGLLASMRYALIEERRPRIWMHCASLGEFEQGRPLLEKLRKKHPGYAIVLTFFSPSGYEVRKHYEGADYIFYLPLDSFFNAKRFLKIVQPKVCIFVKYEFWYFYLLQAARQDIPAILISAIFRKSQPFFQWYGRLHRRMLHCFTHIFVQDAESVQLLGKIGIEDVTIAGDTRFDRVTEAIIEQKELPIADVFSKGANILVAGSTWAEDEHALNKLMSLLPADWKLILAPHEIHEAHISEIEKLFGDVTVRWSQWNEGNNKRILIVDKIGLLLQLYRYGKAAWIGGGFGTKGLHNVLEAAVYGIPVVFGPNYQKSREARELVSSSAAIVINDIPALANSIISWDTKSDNHNYEQICSLTEHYVAANAGATIKILDYFAEKKLLSKP